jgi:hypothetical protein
MIFDSGGGTNLVDQCYTLTMGWIANISIPLLTSTHWGNRIIYIFMESTISGKRLLIPGAKCKNSA